MINEIGHFALVLALGLAAAQALFSLLGAAQRNLTWMTIGRRAAYLQFFALTLSFAALTKAFLVSDFSLLVVAENSHSAKPLIFKFAGVWGNHEGSILLWVLILALFGAAVSRFGRGLPTTLQARVIGVQGLIGLGFLAFIVATSDPFVRIDCHHSPARLIVWALKSFHFFEFEMVASYFLAIAGLHQTDEFFCPERRAYHADHSDR